MGNKPVEYPLYFPRTVGCVMIKKPEDLQEYIDEFVSKFGDTEFEFNGKEVIAHNESFHKHKTIVSQCIQEDYDKHRGRNFD